MKRRRCSCIHQLCLLFSSLCYASPTGASCDTNDASADSLDSMIRSHASRTLVGRRTGVVYDVPLPENFSDVKAAAVKIRSRTLWLEGIKVSSFQIPPRAISIPPIRRAVLVYQNLGNRSDCYYGAQSYSLATPVFGLLAYDGNGLDNKKLDLNIQGRRITVSFPRVEFPKGSNPTQAKCITFGANGSQHLDDLKGKDACLTKNGGHFAIVVPSEEVLAPPPVRNTRKAKRKWPVWVTPLGLGAVSLIFLCLVAMAIPKFAKKKRMEKMARRAEEAEVLETVWVRGSKMPSASMVRTQPVLENGTAP